MSNLFCRIFGHRIEKESINTKRFYARCKRCWTGLKVSYDMSYGDTYITGDYGNQKTFCWCDCGNELCSSNSYVDLMNDINRYEYYKCSKCGQDSKWDFDCIVPIRINLNK